MLRPSIVCACAAVTLFAVSPSLADSISVRHLTLRGIEGEVLRAALPPVLGATDESTTVVMVAPGHGDFAMTPKAWPAFTYTPHQDDYFGRDRFEVDVVDPGGARTRLVYEVEVLPRHQLLFGRWKMGSSELAGLYDTFERILTLCYSSQIVEEDGRPVRVLLCNFHQVKGVPAGAIAVVLPGASDEVDGLALFDPAAGTLYQLAANGENFQVATTEIYPNAKYRIPVFGQWNGESSGGSLAFVDRLGNVGMLDQVGRWVEWRAPLQVWPGDHLSWPIRWPVGDRDGIALFEPEFGHALYVTSDGVAGADDCEPRGLDDPRRPFRRATPVNPNEPASRQRTDVLIGSPAGLYLENIIFDAEDPGYPQTMPIKFPGDPTG